MKNLVISLLLPLAFASLAAHAEDPQPAPGKSQPSQSELALDHGPHAQVTPAVKRARQEAAKAAAASQPSQSK